MPTTASPPTVGHTVRLEHALAWAAVLEGPLPPLTAPSSPVPSVDSEDDPAESADEAMGLWSADAVGRAPSGTARADPAAASPAVAGGALAGDPQPPTVPVVTLTPGATMMDALWATTNDDDSAEECGLTETATTAGAGSLSGGVSVEVPHAQRSMTSQVARRMLHRQPRRTGRQMHRRGSPSATSSRSWLRHRCASTRGASAMPSLTHLWPLRRAMASRH